ncbi:hypothetical protein FACS189421_00350 [Bacteroidia bacterium]|nr:hypothetical protein FACS189421_00350 [Bacteroidia bacterium]GHT47490.1 hypothetical protein FACS189440_08160 [Bacteroidia bacterium]
MIEYCLDKRFISIPQSYETKMNKYGIAKDKKYIYLWETNANIKM